MSDKQTSKPTKSQPQRQRFIDTAKEVEADETGEEFDKAFERIVPPNRPNKKVD